MAEITTKEVREFLSQIQGQEITLDKLRSELRIDKQAKSFDTVRNILFQLAKAKVVRYVDRGRYKIVTQVSPVPIFSVQRERRPPFELIFPRDFETMMEMDFAKYIVLREGDLITVGGVKSKGKTTLAMNICGENIDKKPVLMGNEYTNLQGEPMPRFLNRLDAMDCNKEGGWIDWVDVDGQDKLTLLPVREDFAEHIIKDRINIIDWINLDGDRLYDIGKILSNIKVNLGRGVGIAVLQKGEGNINPRGGQFVRDFSDLEILLDGFGKNDDDILLTIKGAKEKKKPIVGKTYAYTITGGGTKIMNFREVNKCYACHGTGYTKSGECDACNGKGYKDAKLQEEF